MSVFFSLFPFRFILLPGAVAPLVPSSTALPLGPYHFCRWYWSPASESHECVRAESKAFGSNGVWLNSVEISAVPMEALWRSGLWWNSPNPILLIFVVGGGFGGLKVLLPVVPVVLFSLVSVVLCLGRSGWFEFRRSCVHGPAASSSRSRRHCCRVRHVSLRCLQFQYVGKRWAVMRWHLVSVFFAWSGFCLLGFWVSLYVESIWAVCKITLSFNIIQDGKKKVLMLFQ